MFVREWKNRGVPSRPVRVDYNKHRPHGALGHLTPSEDAKSGRKTGREAARL